MPKEKFYIDELDDTFVGTLEQLKQRAIVREQTSFKAYEAVKCTDYDLFFCIHFQEVCEKGHCGKECKFYKPRNGKSGCCIHVGQLYEPTSKFVEVILK